MQSASVSTPPTSSGSSSPRLSTYTVTRRGEGLPITRRQGFKYLNLAPLFKGKTAEPFFVTMPYNEVEQKVAIKLSTHQGQEMDIVIKGKCACRSARTSEELGEGDSIYYNSGTPHGMIAVGGEECTLYAVVMRPQKEKKPEKDTFEARSSRPNRIVPTAKRSQARSCTPRLDENGIFKIHRFHERGKSLTSRLTLSIKWRKKSRISLRCSGSQAPRGKALHV